MRRRYLAIFGVNVQHLLISFSSVAVAFAFVFGNSLREVYESIMWLFVVNPYDEGAHPHSRSQLHSMLFFQPVSALLSAAHQRRLQHEQRPSPGAEAS